MFAAALLASVFLAQNAADPATLNQAMIFIGGLTAVALIGNQLMGAIINFKKLKGVDPSDDRRYATKSEHEALTREVSTIKAEFSALTRSINHSFNDILRAVGRLEGKIDKKSQD
jgi:hypothetical protein